MYAESPQSCDWGPRGAGLLGLLAQGSGRAGNGGGGIEPRFITLARAGNVSAEGLPEIGHTGGRAIGGLERDGADHLDVSLASGHGFGQVGNGVRPGLAHGNPEALGGAGQLFPGHGLKEGSGDCRLACADFAIHLFYVFLLQARVLLGGRDIRHFLFIPVLLLPCQYTMQANCQKLFSLFYTFLFWCRGRPRAAAGANAYCAVLINNKPRNKPRPA